jgi:ribosomal protein S18 acetylase RimI-like enzyme
MLYRVQKNDIVQACTVLADAFKLDPLWHKIFAGDSNLEKRFFAMSEAPIRQGLKYGEVYATSVNFEGIVAWVPGQYADMSLWQVMYSGNIPAVMNMGLNAIRRMGPALKPVVADRRKHMAGRPYLYLLIIGVATAWRGQGFGRKLLDAVINQSEREGLPLYLDVQVEENVKMYQHFGCQLINTVTLPNFNIPIWEMIREPQS